MGLKKHQKIKILISGYGCDSCGSTSGSGWVGVGSFERGEQCGSNGVNLSTAVAVLAGLWRFENGSEKTTKN
jgi:hypothetical protein